MPSVSKIISSEKLAEIPRMNKGVPNTTNHYIQVPSDLINAELPRPQVVPTRKQYKDFPKEISNNEVPRYIFNQPTSRNMTMEIPNEIPSPREVRFMTMEIPKDLPSLPSANLLPQENTYASAYSPGEGEKTVIQLPKSGILPTYLEVPKIFGQGELPKPPIQTKKTKPYASFPRDNFF